MLARQLVAVALGLAAAFPAGAHSVAASPSAPPIKVDVIVPKDYARQPRRHWPVVYLLNTLYPSCTPGCTPVSARVAAAPWITVVEHDSSVLSDYVDWADGSQKNEQRWGSLVKWVDSRYRTLRTRSARAIGGISAGGYGAFVLAGRHPELFGAAGSISGPIDIRGEVGENEPIFVFLGGPEPTTPPQAVWGTPGLGAGWTDYNPRDLLSRLKNTRLYHSTSTGVPCAGDDPMDVPIEVLVFKMNEAFERSAQAAGVRTTFVQSQCGVHSYDYFAPRVLEWLASLPFTRR